MKKIIYITSLLFLLVILNTFSISAVSEDPVDVGARVKEAQGALNVQGFDSAKAVGTGFSDSVNPYTGALSITQTDVVVPGRNGMDIVLTRSYSSNIFANINSFGGGGSFACDSGNSKAVNDIVCDDCLLPQTLPYGNSQNFRVWDSSSGNFDSASGNRNMHRCSTANDGHDSSSFIRAKYLGRGWSLNYMESKFKDPTPVVLEGVVDPYEFVSARGINSISINLFGNEESLILPGTFNENNKWTKDLAYEGFTGGLGYAPIKTLSLAEPYYSSDGYNFVAYTDDFSPVAVAHGNNDKDQLAVYFGKDGRTYSFNHYVPFCGKFDDVPVDTGVCNDLLREGYDINERNNIFNWAENVYVGSYLGSFQDSFGNGIAINHYGMEGGTATPTPFINCITTSGLGDSNCGSIGQTKFHYINDPLDSDYDSSYPTSGIVNSGDLKIDSRLSYIRFMGLKGVYLYQVYQYQDFGNLWKTWTATDYLDPIGSKINETLYEYNYNYQTQELISVLLPTGAMIEYEYAWTENLPSIDAVRGYKNPIDYEMPRRVIVERRVTGGGACSDTSTPFFDSIKDDTCVWKYEYRAIGTLPNIHMQTTVVDPFGDETVYKIYPATTPTLNYR